MRTDRWEAAALHGSLEIHVQSFLDDLAAAGYAPPAVAHRRSIVMAFVRWTRAERLAVQDLGETHLAAFVKRRPHTRDTRRKELAALRRFLAHLRALGMLPAPARPASPADDLVQRYVAHLRTDRGLAENSILVYALQRQRLTRAQAGGREQSDQRRVLIYAWRTDEPGRFPAPAVSN